MAVPRECVTPRILSYATELHQPNTLGTSHAQLRGFSGLTRNHLLLVTWWLSSRSDSNRSWTTRVGVSQLHQLCKWTLATDDIGTTILALTLDSSIFLFLSPYVNGLSHGSICASGRIFLGFHAHTHPSVKVRSEILPRKKSVSFYRKPWDI